jgi:hypothetical protein
MIRQIVKGSRSEKILRWIGKLAPRGVISAAAGTALGTSVAGPAGFVLGPALGQGAAMAADRMAQNSVNSLRDFVARGGAIQVPPSSVPYNALGNSANALSGGSIPMRMAPTPEPVR